MLKPEKINGKMYQPVEQVISRFECKNCALAFKGSCRYVKCSQDERDDKLNVYYISIEGE